MGIKYIIPQHSTPHHTTPHCTSPHHSTHTHHTTPYHITPHRIKPNQTTTYIIHIVYCMKSYVEQNNVAMTIVTYICIDHPPSTVWVTSKWECCLWCPRPSTPSHSGSHLKVCFNMFYS